ncbi:MAG: MotA/TolQ/ExbB proton channel family protein [Proteobacteria bacterium]|nr:MotA/TolQ/ExbB proton channel family protein [Pseudomonadota bacterium]
MGLFIAGTAMGGRLASFDVLGLVWEASLVVQLVLVLLAVFSVVSWAIIAFKGRELSRALQDSEAFVEVYHEESSSQAYDAAKQLDRSPLAAVFLAGCAEMNRAAKRTGSQELDEASLRLVHKHLSWAAEREAQQLERGLSFLATTGSSAPFIGLFGTVVGIMQAFQGIAESGSASLAVVAPGIAEALIATGVGLFAAIPATIFYNYFGARADVIKSSLELFTEEFQRDLEVLSRQTGQPLARAFGE